MCKHKFSWLAYQVPLTKPLQNFFPWYDCGQYKRSIYSRDNDRNSYQYPVAWNYTWNEMWCSKESYHQTFPSSWLKCGWEWWLILRSNALALFWSCLSYLYFIIRTMFYFYHFWPGVASVARVFKQTTWRDAVMYFCGQRCWSHFKTSFYLLDVMRETLNSQRGALPGWQNFFLNSVHTD